MQHKYSTDYLLVFVIENKTLVWRLGSEDYDVIHRVPSYIHEWAADPDYVSLAGDVDLKSVALPYSGYVAVVYTYAAWIFDADAGIVTGWRRWYEMVILIQKYLILWQVKFLLLKSWNYYVRKDSENLTLLLPHIQMIQPVKHLNI